MDYKRTKIINSFIFRKQNYNLLNKGFNSLIVVFNTNQN